MVATRFSEHLLTGDHASRPAFGDVPEGALYACSDHDLIYQSDGTSAWSTWADVSGAGGGIPVTIGDAKGDLVGFSAADTPARVAAAAGDGYALASDSAATPGVAWKLGLPIVAACASDHDNATTTATEVTDLSKTLATGTYEGRYTLMLASASTSVGPRLALNFTGTVTNKVIVFRYPSTGTTAATGDIDNTAGAPAGNLYEGQAIQTFSTTAPNLGPAGIAAANESVLGVIEFVIIVTVAGDLELWHGSESATNTKVVAGSSLVLHKTA